jgi:prepilin-type N-terminal cleavage/methylation domain-containing protein/prepilin-type processing-associated H-X9-DG protein
MADDYCAQRLLGHSSVHPIEDAIMANREISSSGARQTWLLPIRRSTRRSGRHGFTLIELLVVVAIIALLISILLPSLAGARKQAQFLICGTNLATVGKAVHMYSQENRGVVLRGYWYGTLSLLPERIAPIIGGPKAPLIQVNEDPALVTTLGKPEDRDKLLAPIFAKMPILQCPTFPDTTKPPVVNSKGQVVSQQPYDYVVNDFEFDKSRASKKQSSTAGVAKFTKLDRIPSPGRLVHVTEANRNRDIAFFGKHDIYEPDQHLWWGTDPRMITDGRHAATGKVTMTTKGAASFPGRANFLFFDGHRDARLIRSIRINDFTPYLSPDLYRP